MKDPQHDITKPFTMNEVWSVAESFLNAERFDRVDEEEKGNLSISLTSLQNDENDESDDEDANDEQEIDVRDKVRQSQMPKITRTPSKSITTQEKSKSVESTEIESLIDRMLKMSISDSKYGLLYYKALKLDPMIAQVVHP